MTPSVLIYLMTNTSIRESSIRTSFLASTHQRTIHKERGTNASHQPFPCMFCCVLLFVVVVAHQIDALLPVAGVVAVVVKERGQATTTL